MSKPRSAKSGSKASGINNTIDLAAEAAAMEHKLLELKRAMEKERAKREHLVSAAAAGSHWKSANTISARVVRSGRSTNPAATTGLVPPDHSSPGQYGSKMPGAGAPSAGQLAFKSPQQGTPPSQTSPAPAHHAAPSSSSSSAKHHPPSAAATFAAEQPSISGSRIAVPPPAGGRSAAQGSSSGRRADVLAVHQNGGEVEGMGCGTDVKELADGHFNEGDSHRSFLEALNEWRRGNKAADDGGGAPAEETTSSRPASRSATVMEVQTDAMPRPALAARPSSARPIMLFDKLVISENSRHAGQAAGGDPIPTPRARPMSASPGGPSKPPSTPPPATPSTSSPMRASTSSLGAVGAGKTPGSEGGAAAIAAGASSGPAAPSSASAGRLAVLAKLEDLERAQQASDDEDEDDRSKPQVAVLSAITKGLTKGVRLPDNIVVPGNENE